MNRLGSVRTKFYARCVKCGTKTIPTVKGMTNMNYSKQTISFVDHLVDHYAKFDKLSQCYSLDISDISDFDIHEFSTFLMLEDESWASEATGPDNPSYEKTMMPALLRYMKNTTDKDEEIEFTKAWRDGVASYFTKSMQELIDERCNDKLYDENEEAGYFPRHHPDNNELYWSRH